jgi:hypothetical protein
MQYEITATVIRQLLQKSTARLPPNRAAAFKPAKKLPRNGSARAGFEKNELVRRSFGISMYYTV